MNEGSLAWGDPVLEDNFVVVQGRNSSQGSVSLHKNWLVITFNGSKCMGRYLNNSEQCQHTFFYSILEVTTQLK